MKFEEIGIGSQLSDHLKKHKIEQPTQIQEKGIPIFLSGKDFIARSDTGSGKTLCFALPILEKIEAGRGVQSLIIVPTRELAKQICLEFQKFSHFKNVRAIAIYGGTSMGAQINALGRADIVVGTPGRLLDLLERRALNLSKVNVVVLDEADRMLDMGFIRDIEDILKATPPSRQTMFFSATVPEEIMRLGRKFLRNPVSVSIVAEQKRLLEQAYYTLPKHEKISYLVHSLKKEDVKMALVFCKMKHFTRTLARALHEQGIKATSLNGNMSQSQRERSIQDFKDGRFSVLVATDVAARGLHIDNLTHVYNFELPMDLDSYTHRVGRTARAGEAGKAISLVSEDEYNMLQRIVGLYRDKMKRLEKEEFAKLQVNLKQSGGSGGGRPSFGGNRRFGNRRDNADSRRDSRDGRGRSNDRGDDRASRFAKYNS